MYFDQMYRVVPLQDSLGIGYYVGSDAGLLAVFNHPKEATLFAAIMNLSFYLTIGIA